jgi:hypothetical protein
LVRAHQHAATRVAAGLAHLPDGASAFAATQAAWRFLNNPRVGLDALAEPLRQAGRDALAGQDAPCALLVHDWCKLGYGRHPSKADRLRVTHESDVGYDLATALLVRAPDGSPVAPLELRLAAADGVHTTRGLLPPGRTGDHLDQVLPAMRASAGWGLPLPLVHVIDREADSLGHYRQWDAAGQRFLVRADDRVVTWEGREAALVAVADALQRRGEFREARAVLYKGKPARQEVAATEVLLCRPSRHREPGGKRRQSAGRPLGLRLVVARVYGEGGQLLAQWLLLTNVAEAWADAADVALWYYWRWRIESYHKLLKSLGHEIEKWQQETAAAVARRLLVAAMACVVVWGLERAEGADAAQMRGVLVRLSGRQMKYGKECTAPSLLAGMHALLSVLSLLEQTDLDTLRRLVESVLPTPSTG